MYLEISNPMDYHVALYIRLPSFFGFLLTLICNVCFMALTSLSGRDVVLSFRC